MQTLLEKRQNLHRQLDRHEQTNNDLLEQIDKLHSLANLGMVSAMIAHEMNNVLTPLANFARLSLQNLDDDALIKKTLEKTVANSDRAAKILESMLTMADAKPREKAQHNLANLVDETFDCIARDFSKDRIRLSVSIPPDMLVTADAIALQQVMMNLILNARLALLDSPPANRRLTVSAAKTRDSIKISVRDTGCGIEPENIKKIFEPFFTTRGQAQNASSAGTGLGLAFCKRTIDAHNGLISVESTPKSGTTFDILLPIQ